MNPVDPAVSLAHRSRIFDGAAHGRVVVASEQIVGSTISLTSGAVLSRSHRRMEEWAQLKKEFFNTIAWVSNRLGALSRSKRFEEATQATAAAATFSTRAARPGDWLQAAPHLSGDGRVLHRVRDVMLTTSGRHDMPRVIGGLLHALNITSPTRVARQVDHRCPKGGGDIARIHERTRLSSNRRARCAPQAPVERHRGRDGVGEVGRRSARSVDSARNAM
eukprot:scaffold40845_cov32-Tisochrysis_lutea.AAC.2